MNRTIKLGASLACARGDPAGVLLATESVRATGLLGVGGHPGIFTWRALEADALTRVGRLDDAGKVIGLEATTVRQWGAHEDLGDMLLLQSSLARLQGQLAEAQQLAERAVGEQRRSNSLMSLSLALAECSLISTHMGNSGSALR